MSFTGTRVRTRVAAVLAASLFFLSVMPVSAFKDPQAREELEILRGQLNQIDSALQVRQMGLGEQMQALREEIARLESMINEIHRDNGILNQQLEVDRIENQERFVQYNRTTDQRFAVVDENIKRLLKGIEDLQTNIRTLSDSLRTMSDFEKKQEARISQVQGGLQEQFNVIVEEVGSENVRLQKELAGIDSDVARFQGFINTVDGEVRRLAGRIENVSRQVQDLSRRQASAAAAPGSASPSAGEHTVQQGETLSTIARDYGITVEDIMAANQITNANLIQVGQALIIPGR
jgi:LysM repeat protein